MSVYYWCRSGHMIQPSLILRAVYRNLQGGGGGKFVVWKKEGELKLNSIM